mmetsp:Transcript_28144/g.77712  ORF Transcript_28144/g.77712 Transcript_28144/m.77712 type:complete len:99 (-) Transcript_28144:125-421(-)
MLARVLHLVLAALMGLAAVTSAQQLRGADEAKVKATVAVAPQQLGEFDKEAEPTHAPPHWNVDPPMNPILAFVAVVGIPLFGIPCAVKCKNGDLKRLF